MWQVVWGLAGGLAWAGDGAPVEGAAPEPAAAQDPDLHPARADAVDVEHFGPGGGREPDAPDGDAPLRCEGVAGGLLGPMVLGTALTTVGPALAACAPGGAATTLRWTWSGGAPSGLAVVATSAAAAGTCVTEAFGRVQGQAQWTAACSATLLTGDPSGAAAALAKLPAP